MVPRRRCSPFDAGTASCEIAARCATATRRRDCLSHRIWRLRMPRMVIALLTLAAAPTIARFAYAQGTAADYVRAANAAERIDRATVDVPEAPTWLPNGRFWYRKSVR